MNSPLSDISNATDIDQLVAHFYRRALSDSIIGFFFTDIARIDLDSHLITISRFWQRQLLGTGDYNGRPLEVHQQLQQHAELTEHHFHRWLYLFHQSVDALFNGPRAELAKSRSTGIAKSMHEGLQNRHMQAILQQREKSGLFFFDPPSNT
jgi:hemoglobin